MRAVLDEIRSDCGEERVLLVAHQVVVLVVRYVVEGMTEPQVLDVDRQGEVVNCSVTSYAFAGGTPHLTRYNEAAPVEDSDVTVTAEPVVRRAP